MNREEALRELNIFAEASRKDEANYDQICICDGLDIIANILTDEAQAKDRDEELCNRLCRAIHALHCYKYVLGLFGALGTLENITEHKTHNQQTTNDDVTKRYTSTNQNKDDVHLAETIQWLGECKSTSFKYVD